MTARVDLEELEWRGPRYWTNALNNTETWGVVIDDKELANLIAELRDLRARMEGAPVVKVRGKVGEFATIVVSHNLVGKKVRLVVCDE